LTTGGRFTDIAIFGWLKRVTAGKRIYLGRSIMKNRYGLTPLPVEP
jgi:hypothetical protein